MLGESPCLTSTMIFQIINKMIVEILVYIATYHIAPRTDIILSFKTLSITVIKQETTRLLTTIITYKY